MKEIELGSEKEFCFCTAVYGIEYLRLASLLAEDLQKYSPSSKLIIVTNRPGFFAGQSNVLAIKHRCRGVQPYHERRFAINYGLSFFDTVISIDSDARILAPIAKELSFKPGLAAKSCCGLQKHMAERLKKPTKERLAQQNIICRMAQSVDLDITNSALKFINEFLFAVTKDQGREQEFLRLWGELAILADTLGMHKHPTYAMAMAAVKSGFPVYRDEMPGLEIFDDRVIRWNIQRNKMELTPQIESMLDQQHEIENGKKSITKRISRKVRKVARKRILIPFNRGRIRLLNKVNPKSLLAYPTLK